MSEPKSDWKAFRVPTADFSFPCFPEHVHGSHTTNWEAHVWLFCSRCTLDSLKTLWGASEKLIRVNILCRPFLCLITQLADVYCSPGRTNSTHRLPLIWCTHPYKLPPSLSRSLLCPLTSINVMVHQRWRTLSRGCTPLLIWLLLMGENTINKFNYPWPISSGGDMRLLFMSSLTYEYEEV